MFDPYRYWCYKKHIDTLQKSRICKIIKYHFLLGMLDASYRRITRDNFSHRVGLLILKNWLWRPLRALQRYCAICSCRGKVNGIEEEMVRFLKEKSGILHCKMSTLNVRFNIRHECPLIIFNLIRYQYEW